MPLKRKERRRFWKGWRSWISTCSAQPSPCRLRGFWREREGKWKEKKREGNSGECRGCGKERFLIALMTVGSFSKPCFVHAIDLGRIWGELVLGLVFFRRHSFLYLAVAFTISVGTYLGLFRTQIRKQFNIGGSDSSLDDCVNHIVCPCCTLCQESRTLEINNVQDGVWHGRGDAICIGRYGEGSKAFFELRQPPLMPTKSPEFNSMERGVGSDNHAWDVDISHSEPLVPLSQ
ncbi:uncharacterized protein LOC131237141 isoform X2 [Magnolia sinica]|uniref:uncharacterized protein LOC131237141 isoform X2 n=1 Tax=Magnolia sinica TaxID=86752 RepID=UPI0026594571|nr:uncharacterized protein LOC131237141 isoform X2 [Magnolia sinica]